MNLAQLITAGAVLARLGGAEVGLEEAVREERFRSRDEAQFRAAKGLDGERGRLDVLRRCALRRQLGGPGADALLEARADAFRRDDFLQRWAARGYGQSLQVPGSAAVRAELEGSLPALPERWRLSHIFLAAPTEEARAAASARLEALRPVLRTLADFQRQARAMSQSESARRDGRLGVVKSGYLRPEAEAAIRRLPVGEVSAPVATGPGVHLFWVEDHLPAGRWITDARVEQEVAKRRAEGIAASRVRVLERAPAAEPGPLASDGLPTFLRVGERTMSGEILRAVIGGASDPERLKAWIESERLWRLALREGSVDAAERQRGDDLAADLRLRSRIEGDAEGRIVEPNEDEIAAYFAAHGERFRRPAQMAVRALRVPIPRDRDPFEEERRLDGAIESLRAQGRGVEALAAQFALPPTAVSDLDLRPVIEVAGALGPRVFEQVKELAPGALSAPIHDAEVWVVVEVTAREAQRPLSAGEAAPEVRAAIRVERRRAALQARTSELLAAFELTPAGREWVAEGTK